MSRAASQVQKKLSQAFAGIFVAGYWTKGGYLDVINCGKDRRSSELSPLEEAMHEFATGSIVNKPKSPLDSFETIDKDAYPNLSRHGANSLLKKYLSPEIYNLLRHKRTASGVQLNDLIQAGVSLPWGSRPPRGIAGVYAGDAESYSTFSILLSPLIEEHHKASHKARLRRHLSNLDFNGLSQRQLDTDYILYTRMRLARSLEGFRFAPCIGRGERRAVEALLKDCSADWPKGSYVSLIDMTNRQHDDLVNRHLMFPDPDEFAISAGLGRDWPDGRGIYCDSWSDEMPRIMMWVNARDHLCLISNAKGGDVHGVFTRLSMAIRTLETSLYDRGHSFVKDPRLGFLNTCPADIGTALRASMYVKLVRLGQKPGFDELVHRLRLEARPLKYRSGGYTGMFDIANIEALGKTEVDLINIMIEGVGTLIDLEKRLEKGEDLDIPVLAGKKGTKAFRARQQ